MPSHREFGRADDFAEHKIPLASRATSNVYAINSAHSEPTLVENQRLHPNEHLPHSGSLYDPNQIIVSKSDRLSSLSFPHTRDDVLIGPKCTMTLYVTEPVRTALWELKYKKFSGSHYFGSMKANNSGFITYALTEGALHYEEWWETVPLDGRSSSSTFSVNSITRRTTFSTFNKVKELIIHTHLAISEKKSDLVSVEAVKLVATTWGLRQLLKPE